MSQCSVYFSYVGNNRLEMYFELPNWAETYEVETTKIVHSRLISLRLDGNGGTQ